MRSFRMLPLLVLTLLPLAAHADTMWDFGINLGGSASSDDHFHESGTLRLYGGYRFNDYVGIHTSSVLFDKFASKSEEDIYLQVYGQMLGVTAHIPIKRVILNAGTGVYGWRALARAYDKKIGEDTGVSPYVDLSMDILLPAHMMVGGGVAWFGDVSGADIGNISVHYGLRF